MKPMPLIILCLGALAALVGLAITVALAVVVAGPLMVLLVMCVKKIVAPRAPVVVKQNP